MTHPMMEGPWQAKTLVTEYLNADLPTRIADYRTLWSKDATTLPLPGFIVQYEPLALDHWPSVITFQTGTTNIVREDYTTGGDPIYRVTYAMRTYVWVKSELPDRVTEMRDNLTTVIRAALLDHPALKEVPRFEHCDPKIEEETMTEEFSDLTLLKGDRYLAGAYIAYNLTVSETIGRAPLTTSLAYTFAVDVEQMGKTANAPTLLLAQGGDQQVSLIWKAPTWFGGVDPIDWYQIEQSVDSGQTWTLAVANTGKKLPGYTVTGLANGIEHLFRVAAVNSFGVGAASAPSNAVTPAP